MISCGEFEMLFYFNQFFLFFKNHKQKKKHHFQRVKYESNGAAGCCGCFRAVGNDRELKTKILIN